jgi:hypothetical protein
VGHHEGLLFFGNEGVGDVFEVDGLCVGSLGDELSDSLRGSGHSKIVVVLLVHAHAVVSFRAVDAEMTLRTIQIGVELVPLP